MRLIDADAIPSMGISNFSVMFRKVIDNMPTVDLWHYPSRGELPEKREVPYQCLCKIHAVDEDENVFYVALWFDGSHFYVPDMNGLYWEENDCTDIVICWQYIIPPKEERNHMGYY